ncbi:hypothetical protein CROQUDRAFT_625709 [Cronartium quercuum f. sp. fusiforme G11]|uniref:Uncharacterized protein n=1 Tax=Cronartium quercuum f. sp. fusiforme G11 TaxID=708437 RepID=A0A9P6NHZ9_9BASI|nr:hypothetical protein CROQUDRAFT_625709 [Cronartium quercuum f. sp. fusiforme G11]
MPKKESTQPHNITVAAWMAVKVKLVARYVSGWISGLEAWLEETVQGQEPPGENLTLAKAIFQCIMTLARYEDPRMRTQSRSPKLPSAVNGREPINVFDRALQSIILLSGQTFLDHSVKEGVLMHWLRDLVHIWPTIDDNDKIILNQNLQRLLDPPPKIASDISSMSPQLDSSLKDSPRPVSTQLDPWLPLWTALKMDETGNREDLSMALGMISIIADSSCRVTAKTLHQIISKIGSSELKIQQCLPLAKLLYTSSISKNLDRMILASLSILLLGSHTVTAILEALHLPQALEETCVASVLRIVTCIHHLNVPVNISVSLL